MTQRVIIIGAGGHAQVVADILLRMRDSGESVEPQGFLDDNPELQHHELLGLPVLGTISDLALVPHESILVAIGANGARRTLYERFRQQGERFAIARHPSAIIAPSAQIGPGTTLCAGAIVNPGALVGANVILNTASSIDHHNRIGDHAHIAPGSHLGGDVEVGEGAFIGIGATVMPQRRIGAWAIAGAGAVVHADLPDHAVAVGVPARIIRYQQK